MPNTTLEDTLAEFKQSTTMILSRLGEVENRLAQIEEKVERIDQVMVQAKLEKQQRREAILQQRIAMANEFSQKVTAFNASCKR